MAQARLLTTEDFEAFISFPDNADRRFELIDGEVVEKVPTQEHGICAGNLVTDMNLWLRQNPIGRVSVEARHRPAGNERNDRLPDVSFVRDLTKPVVRGGAANFMPDLVVEIQSPDDDPEAMREKARFYLANGTKIVWLVFMQLRIVEVITADGTWTVGEDDVLSGLDVMPGFELPVKNIFFNL